MAVLSSLPALEHDLFSQCTDSEELLSQVANLAIIKKNSRRSERYLAPIRRFSKRFSSYFASFDVLVQADPIHAAPAWGAVRVILQLASNYASFFEKLTRLLDRLGDVFPVYDEIADLCREQPSTRPSARLAASVQHVYSALFEFLHNLIGVFHKADGAVKNTARVAASLTWKPFDIRFDDVLERMKSQQKLILFELSIMTKKGVDEETYRAAEERVKAENTRKTLQTVDAQTSEMKTLFQQQQKDNQIYRIQKWLDPPAFARNFERAQELREEGTGYWIFGDPTFQRWQSFAGTTTQATSHEKSDIIWVYGNPGCGKTVLAAAAVEELKITCGSAPDTKSTVAYYFFDSTEALLAECRSGYQALLSQILQQHREKEAILDIFAYAIDKLSDGQATASVSELVDVLQLCCEQIGRTFIVLDAIDECQDPETLIPRLTKLAQIDCVSLLLFSRPTVTQLARTVPPNSQIPVSRRNNADISHYLANRLAAFIDDGILPESSKAVSIVDGLARKADGMFLWARLLISYIMSPALSLAQREDALEETNLPDGLEEMYNKILKLILRSNRKTRDLAKIIFIWLVHARRELTSPELEQILLISNKDSKSTSQDKFSDFKSTVITTCAGLVESVVATRISDLGGHCWQFRLIHGSVRDYFLTGSSCIRLERRSLSALEELSTPEKYAHLDILQSCLRYLTYYMPAQPLSGRLGVNPIKRDLARAFPFSEYASGYWANHLLQSALLWFSDPNHREVDFEKRTGEALEVLSAFLNQKLALTAWIEACYVHGHPPPVSPLQEWGAMFLKNEFKMPGIWTDVQKTVAMVLEFSQYLEELERSWGPTLMSEPECIWQEVTAFSPSKFLPHNTGIHFYPLETEASGDDELSNNYIKRISRTTSDGNFIAVLSIVPSRLFDDFYSSKRISPSLIDLSKLSSSWQAQYVIYTVNAQKKIASTTIRLEDTETQQQIWQSLWRGDGKIWHIQFPLAISFDARYFTVLRTIYTVSFCDENSQLRCSSSLLPLEVNGYWISALKQIEEGKTFADYLRDEKLYGRLKCKDRHPCYTYWVFFDGDSRHLCVVDQERYVPNNITMFELQQVKGSGSKFIAKRLRTVQKYLRPFGELAAHTKFNYLSRTFELAFHPYLPVLAGPAYGPTNESIWLWDYSDDHSRASNFARISPDLRELTFSECGGYIVATCKEARAPQIIRIPDSILLAAARSNDQAMRVDAIENKTMAPKATLVASASSPLALLRDLPTQATVKTVHKMTVGVDDCGNTTLTRLTNQNGTICATRSTGANDESVVLTHLPRWAQSESVAPALVLSNDSNGIARIVMNKQQSEWVALNGTRDTNFPAVLERDQRTIVQKPVRRQQQQQKVEDGKGDYQFRRAKGVP